MTSVFHYQHPFTLESGVTLPGYHLAYTTHGKLNAARNNVVWVFHALTANADPLEWWPGMVRTAFEPGVLYKLNSRMLFQPLCQGQGIIYRALDAQTQGFKTLQ